MSKKKQRVHYQYSDIQDVKKPTGDEIKIILRAADEIIYSAGRSMLAKILKGSKDKKVLKYSLEECPSYGYYQLLTISEITKIIDWMIIKNYLEIKYDGRLPMIVFSAKGWELYKPVFAEELYGKIFIESSTSIDKLIEQLKQTNREVVLILLKNIGDSKNIGFIRFLEKWKKTEVKKVRSMINDTIKNIKAQ